MKVLVTGAAGFIGSNLVHYLHSEHPQWQIVALDLLTYAGNLENLAEVIDSKRLDFKKIDINDAQAVDALFAANKFDLVFHLAAETHVDRSIHAASEFARTNAVGTQNLLDAARTTGAGRFVHISTDEVYGSLGPTGVFVETTPLDPSSAYSASKAGSDLLVLASHRTHGQDVVVTRCTNNYGPYQFPEKLIPLFITNALEGKRLPLYGDGMNVRSWIYVGDHCEALLAVAERAKAGEVYNVGGTPDGELPNIEVTKKVLAILGKPESLIERVADRPGHDRRYAVDGAKMLREVGWKARTNFADGIKSTVQWYLDHENWWRRVKSGEYKRFYELNYANRRSKT